MPTKKQVQDFGAETWSKGTEGRLNQVASHGRAQIIDARYTKRGSLAPRPPWHRYGVSTSGQFPVVISTETLSDLVTFYVGKYKADVLAIPKSCLVVVEPERITVYELPKWPTSATLPIIANEVVLLAGAGDKFGHGHITPIGDTEVLVNTTHILLREDPDTGDAITAITGLGNLAAAFTDPSNAVIINGSTVHAGRAYYFGEWYTSDGEWRHLHAPGRVVYSDPFDYTTFSSSDQYFDVDGEIAGMGAVGSNLFLWTKDGSWYVQQGQGDPDTSPLYNLGKFRINNREQQVGVLNNSLIFEPSDGRTICTIGADAAMDETTLGHLNQNQVSYLSDGPPIDEIDLSRPCINPITDTATVISQGPYLTNHTNGVWTYDTRPDWWDGRVAMLPDPVTGFEWAVVPVDIGGGDWVHHLYRRYAEYDKTGWMYQDRDYHEEVSAYVKLPRLDAPGHANIRVTAVTIDVGISSYTPAGVNRYHDPTMTVQVTTPSGTNTLISNTPVEDYTDLPVDMQARLRFTPNGVLPFNHFAEIVLHFISMEVFKVSVEYEIQDRRDYDI